jgi:hypothetical protein
VFHTLRHANRNPRELEALRREGREPRALPNVRVLAPEGVFVHRFQPHMDGSFSIRIADLDAMDWCAALGLDRLGPSGLLIERVIEILHKGGATAPTDASITAHDEVSYTLGDMLNVIEHAPDITSKSAGFTVSTRRAVSSRLRQAASWGVFTRGGTPLTELCRAGHTTVLEVSGIDTALIGLLSGVLARKVMRALSLPTPPIPISDFLVDEADLVFPRGEQSSGTRAFVEYVKRGRKFGCGLTIATQRPASIHDDILSQLDVVVAHTLAQEKDVTALLKHMPAGLPTELGSPALLREALRTLPRGCVLIADQANAQRAFLARIRTRFTEHGGREAVFNG